MPPAPLAMALDISEEPGVTEVTCPIAAIQEGPSPKVLVTAAAFRFFLAGHQDIYSMAEDGSCWPRSHSAKA